MCLSSFYSFSANPHDRTTRMTSTNPTNQKVFSSALLSHLFLSFWMFSSSVDWTYSTLFQSSHLWSVPQVLPVTFYLPSARLHPHIPHIVWLSCMCLSLSPLFEVTVVKGNPHHPLAHLVPFKQTDQSLPVFLTVTFSSPHLQIDFRPFLNVSAAVTPSHHWHLPSDSGFCI